MKKILTTVAIVLCALLILPSCRMRPKDVKRLQEQAEAGNLKSMEVLMCHGDGVAPDSLLQRYTDILAAAGNYKALTYKLAQESGGNPGWEVMRDKKETARYIKWMKKGADKGNPDCMYQLAGEYSRKKIASPNSTFVDNPYYDADLAMKWTRQAANSCHAFARNSLKYKDGTVNVLSRPRFVFQQIWHYNARGQSFFCKASNATFHFLQDCFSNSVSTIVSRRWWQGLLMLLVMLVVFIGVVFYGFCFKGDSAVSIGTSAAYGWLNGFTLFFIADGVWENVDGVIGSFDGMCHLTRQPATYSLMSDICTWATWLWILVFVFVFIRGIGHLKKQGRLTVWTLLKYILATLMANLLFYLLGGALSIFSEVIAIIAGILLVGAIVKVSGPKPGDIIIYGAGPLGSDVTASPVPGFPGRYRTTDGQIYEKEAVGDGLKRISV